MTRDDLVKQLEKAERQRGRVAKSYGAALMVIQAKNNLHIWDMAYAAGVAAGRDAEAIEEAILARGEK